MARTNRTNRDGRSERGATLAEYAFAIALVVIVALGAATSLENESADALDERGTNIGMPDLDQTAPTLPPTIPDSGATTIPQTTVPASVDATILTTNRVITGNGANPKWQAQVLIRLTNASTGANVVGTISVAWTPSQGNGSTATGTTGSDGEFQFVLNNINGNVASVIFTVTNVVSAGLDYGPPSPVTVTLAKPT